MSDQEARIEGEVRRERVFLLFLKFSWRGRQYPLMLIATGRQHSTGNYKQRWFFIMMYLPLVVLGNYGISESLNNMVWLFWRVILGEGAQQASVFLKIISTKITTV